MKRLLSTIVIVFAFTLCYAENPPFTTTGNVSDQNGEPLRFASITVKGTMIGTLTDWDGNYSFTVPTADAILVCSYVGYITEEIIRHVQINNFVLREDSSSLEASEEVRFQYQDDDVPTYSATSPAAWPGYRF